jgi:hypothetical protein
MPLSRRHGSEEGGALTIFSGERRGEARGVIVTAAGPSMREVLHDLTLPSFRAYADRWRYDVVVEDLPRDGSGADEAAQQAKWRKLGLLRAGLRTHCVVVWLDADVLLTRHDEDVAALLSPRDFQGLVLEHVPAERRVNPNTGVWVLRSCPAAVQFLQAVEDAGRQPGPWADQGAVLAALGWDRGDERYHGAQPGRGNAFSRRTTWLPGRWNQPYLGLRTEEDAYNSTAASYDDRTAYADPCALHFMGLTPQARHRHMRTVLAAGGAAVPA